MNPLQNFLERFQKILTFPGQIKKDVLGCLEKVTHIQLTEKDIEVRDSIVYIRLKHPAIKSEIFMRKQLVLQELKSCLGSKAPIDIR